MSVFFMSREILKLAKIDETELVTDITGFLLHSSQKSQFIATLTGHFVNPLRKVEIHLTASNGLHLSFLKCSY